MLGNNDDTIKRKEKLNSSDSSLPVIESATELNNANRRLGDESTLKPLLTSTEDDEISGLFDKSVI